MILTSVFLLLGALKTFSFHQKMLDFFFKIAFVSRTTFSSENEQKNTFLASFHSRRLFGNEFFSEEKDIDSKVGPDDDLVGVLSKL